MINDYPILNIYKKKDTSSELTSQMLYGEKFKILKKYKNWLKIKTSYDGYVGFIKNKKYLENVINTHKIIKLKSNVYLKKNKKLKLSTLSLPFNSRIKFLKENKKFIKFSKNKWIKKSDLKEINHIEKKFDKIYKIFLNTKYLWGGKSFKGIDCSALIQSFYHYNNKYCPRDTVDQIKFFKKKSKNLDEAGLLIFWKGHVACIFSKKKLIHAYGPKRKVLIMNINKSIKEVKEKSHLKIKGIKKLYAV
jgi:hypothetical protein